MSTMKIQVAPGVSITVNGTQKTAADGPFDLPKDIAEKKIAGGFAVPAQATMIRPAPAGGEFDPASIDREKVVAFMEGSIDPTKPLSDAQTAAVEKYLLQEAELNGTERRSLAIAWSLIEGGE